MVRNGLARGGEDKLPACHDGLEGHLPATMGPICRRSEDKLPACHVGGWQLGDNLEGHPPLWGGMGKNEAVSGVGR